MNPLNRNLPNGDKPASVQALEAKVAAGDTTPEPGPELAKSAINPELLERMRAEEDTGPKVLGQGSMTKGGGFVDWDALIPTMQKADPSSYDPSEAPDPRVALSMPGSPQAIAAALQADGADLSRWNLSPAIDLQKGPPSPGPKQVHGGGTGPTAVQQQARAVRNLPVNAGTPVLSGRMTGKLDPPRGRIARALGIAPEAQGQRVGHGTSRPTTDSGAQRMANQMPGAGVKKRTGPKKTASPKHPAAKPTAQRLSPDGQSWVAPMSAKRAELYAAMTGKITDVKTGGGGPRTGMGGAPVDRGTKQPAIGVHGRSRMPPGPKRVHGGGEGRPAGFRGGANPRITGPITVRSVPNPTGRMSAKRSALYAAMTGKAGVVPGRGGTKQIQGGGTHSPVATTHRREVSSAGTNRRQPRSTVTPDVISGESQQVGRMTGKREAWIRHRQPSGQGYGVDKTANRMKKLVGGKMSAAMAAEVGRAKMHARKSKADRKARRATKGGHPYPTAPWGMERSMDAIDGLEELLEKGAYTGPGVRTGTPGHYEYKYGGSKGGQRGKHGETEIPEHKITVRGKSHAEIAAKLKSGIDKAADLCKTDPPVCAGNLGIVRTWMPQFNDDPKTGGDKDAIKKFLAELKSEGKGVQSKTRKVGTLKATQREIKTAKSYGMAFAQKSYEESKAAGNGGFYESTFGGKKVKTDWHPSKNAIVVSKDGYVLDGHHRYAAMVIADPDFDMPVHEVDATIEEILDKTQDWFESGKPIKKEDFQGNRVDPKSQIGKPRPWAAAKKAAGLGGAKKSPEEVNAQLDRLRQQKSGKKKSAAKRQVSMGFENDAFSLTTQKRADSFGAFTPAPEDKQASLFGGKKKARKSLSQCEECGTLQKSIVGKCAACGGKCGTSGKREPMSAKMKKRQAWRDYAKDFVGKASGSSPVVTPTDATPPAQPGLRRSFGGDLEMDLRKGGLYSFNDSHAKNRSALPAKMLPEYLAAFCEEAYEHERKECEHRKLAPLADEDHTEFWAKRVMSELVQYMRMNKDLARAGKGATYKTIASVLRSRGLIKPEHPTSTPTDRDSAMAMNARIDGQDREVMAFSEIKRGHFREELGKAGAALELSGARDVPAVVVVDDKVDPFQVGARAEAARVGRMGAMNKGFARPSVSHECAIHGFRDLTKSQNLANPDGHCTCG